jgi:hypothetical protein
MAKVTTTIRQVLNYQTDSSPLLSPYSAWFTANQALFNRVAAFSFDMVQAHEKILDLSNKEGLTALEKLTRSNPHPVMPLSKVREDIPAIFRRAAINTALGFARSFYSNPGKQRKRKEKREWSPHLTTLLLSCYNAGIKN